MFASICRHTGAVWGCCILAVLLLSHPCHAQPYTNFDNDVAITNGVPVLLLSSPINGWFLKNNVDFEIWSDSSTVPLRIGFDAPANSLNIEDTTGDVGFGTSSPAASLHVRRQSNPAMRLEATSEAQSWEWLLDGAVLTLRDVTTDRNPIRVEDNVSSNTLYLSNLAGGHVGIGTSSPEIINLVASPPAGEGRHLNLYADEGTARAIVEGRVAGESYLVSQLGSSGCRVVRTRMAANKYVISLMQDNVVNAAEHLFCANLHPTNTRVGIKTANPLKPFQVGDANANDGNGAHVTPGGVWTNASSRTLKEDIQPITSQQARETMRALQPVGYHYKNEPEEKYVGFIAEDVPELVATNDRKSLAPMDVVAVLTKVVQDQDQKLAFQERRLEEQQAINKVLMERLAKLEDKAAK